MTSEDPALAFEAAEIKRHLIINETISSGDSPVQKFYEGAIIFVTGGSGFIGKQLIEKLLRSCNIQKIFMLMRSKKKNTIEERFKKIIEDPVYEYLRKVQPNFVEKIIPIPGDVTQIRLGLSDADWQTIIEEVTIIFHGAATINFVEPLKVATVTNVRGTMEMLNLGKACKNLKSYVHISTAYSHATSQRIKQPVQEQFYDSPVQPDVLVKLVEQVDNDKLDAMTPHLIKNWPNTYAFTKAVAEEAVRNMSSDLPICIVRPAIVIAALREPSPGWIDKSCALGPSGFLLGVGLGVLHLLYRTKDIHLDLIPVDIVNNATISAAYQTVVRRERGETDVKIYTVTGTRNPLSFGHMEGVIRKEASEFATDKAVYAGCCISTDNKLLYLLATYLFHYIPAYILDGILKLLGKRPLLMKVYEKVYQLNNVLGYFMTNDWLFGDSNLMELYWSLSPADRIIYHCDTSVISWTHYILIWCIGIRKYIIKDGLSKTINGRRKQFWLNLIHPLIFTLYLYILYKVFKFLCLCVIYLISFVY